MNLNIDWRQTLEDLQGVDLNDLSSAPYSVKVIGVILAGIAILGLSYYFLVRSDIANLDQLKATEVHLKSEFVQKKAMAINLVAYKRQMHRMTVDFKVLLEQLPNSTHMPDFVNEVTQAGQACSLRFRLLQPGSEARKTFYAELPIKLSVAGTYSQLGHFVSDVAALPRIVTLGSIKLKRNKDGRLLMAMVAKTYRYMKHPPRVRRRRR